MYTQTLLCEYIQMKHCYILQSYSPSYLLELPPWTTVSALLTQQLARLPRDVGAGVEHEHPEVGAVLDELEHSLVCWALRVTEVQLLRSGEGEESGV